MGAIQDLTARLAAMEAHAPDLSDWAHITVSLADVRAICKQWVRLEDALAAALAERRDAQRRATNHEATIKSMAAELKERLAAAYTQGAENGRRWAAPDPGGPEAKEEAQRYAAWIMAGGKSEEFPA